MTAPFFERLRSYYLNVAAVLRGEADAASIFANTSDIGTSRENVYKKFLAQHLPAKCSVFLGGFLFGPNGAESHQLDVIVTTDTAPRFDFYNDGDSGKSFAPVEGTLAVASIKSTLNKATLEDSLLGIASIPPTAPLDGRIAFGVKLGSYDDWPFKVIYASDGIAMDTLMRYLDEFYLAHPQIPLTRRPNVIHVCGKYFISRARPGLSSIVDRETNVQTSIPFGRFIASTENPDLQGIVRVLEAIQERATASTHILYSYWELVNKVVGV